MNVLRSSGSRLVAVVGLLGVAVWWAPSRSVALTLLVLLGLVTLHELGHFIAARLFKVRTPEFSVGFGPLVAARTWRGMQWSIRAVPLGGFVRIEGMESSAIEGPAEAGTEERVELKPWKRMVIAAAGPAANVVVAAVCLIVIMGGMPRAVDESARVRPVANSPAATAGLQPGDRIVRVGSMPIAEWSDVLQAAAHPEIRELAVVPVEVVRSGSRVLVELIPERLANGAVRLGVTWDPETRSATVAEAFGDGSQATWELSKAVVTSMSGLGRALWNIPQQLAGEPIDPQARVVSPLGAARLAEQAADEDGWMGPLALVAAVSLFLAAFNMLPLPPLDGSHVAVAGFETVASKVRRRPVRIDMSRLAPLTLVTVVLVLLLGVTGLIADVVQPL